MSLLIKALQKAEQSKENAGATETQAAPKASLELELTPHHPPHAGHDVSLAEEGGFTDPTPAAKPVPPVIPPVTRTVTAPPEQAAEREAAANLFQAKTDAVTDPGGRRAFWMGLIGLSCLLLLGGGFYFYLETLQQPELVAVRPPQPITPVAPVAPLAEPAPVAQVAPETPPVIAEPQLPAENTVKPLAPIEQAPVASGKPSVAATSAPAATAENKPAAENESVKITRNRKSEPAANATTIAAYQAFMAGDDNTAGRLYRQLLQAEPRNIDALLGLAAVSARQENADQAASHYARALELEPRNGVAQAGLIALMSQADPVAAESRLKSLLAQQPDAAYLHGALGGVYAEQSQWANAQQSYFQAFRLDSTSSEHAYNLAISLDQLAKPELALDYYQRSRDLLPKEGGSIDRTALESRINQLRTSLGK